MAISPEQTLKAYEGEASNVEGFIQDAITGAYGDLKPELQDVRHYETQQLPEFYKTFTGGYGMGTGAADMAPAARMSLASQNVADQATLGRTARDILGVRRKSMEDIISQALRSWELGYGGAQSSYKRWWEQKQWEEQQALEREKIAKMGSGYGDGFVPPGMTSTGALSQLFGLPRIGDRTPTSPSGMTAGQRMGFVNQAMELVPGMNRLEAMRAAGFSDPYLQREGYIPTPVTGGGGAPVGGGTGGVGSALGYGIFQ